MDSILPMGNLLSRRRRSSLGFSKVVDLVVYEKKKYNQRKDKASGLSNPDGSALLLPGST
jgi:hypothetical protein